MNKNMLLGLILFAIILLGGYYMIRKQTPVVVVNTPGTATTTDTSPIPKPVAPIPGAPNVETNPTVTTSGSVAVVNGRVKPNGVNTTYWFEYGTTTAFGTQNTGQVAGGGYAYIGTPAYLSGLKPNTLYYFRLSAQNTYAKVNGQMYTFQTNNNPPTPGSAPVISGVNATNISRTTANMTGQVNPKGFQTMYWFEYGATTGLGNTTNIQTLAATTNATPVSVTVSDLVPATKYYFRLNAQNPYGTNNTQIGSFTTPGPALPNHPVATTDKAFDISSTKATLEGHMNPNGAETTYWFEYGTDGLLASIIGNGTPPQTLSASTPNTKIDANITNLSGKKTYFYRLVGRNSYGTVYGNILSFKTR